MIIKSIIRKSNHINGQYLTDYSKNKDDCKWDYHKSSAEKIGFFYSTSKNYKKYGERMDSCAELLRFKFETNNNGESKLKLKSAQFCRVRFCPVCQWRRSMKWRAKLFQSLPSLLEKERNIRFLFLTLTVRNCYIMELSSTLKLMNEAFTRLRKIEAFKPVKGFIRATEVTKAKDGKAHPHFHCIIAVDKNYFKNIKKSKVFITSEKWSDLWKRCLRVDYNPIIDVRKIKQKGNEIETKAVIETLKYTTKVEDLVSDKDWFLTLTEQLHKKRFIATGGILKDILSEKVSEKEMVLTDSDTLEEEIEELKQSLFFGFEEQSQKYKKVKNPYATGNDGG